MQGAASLTLLCLQTWDTASSMHWEQPGAELLVLFMGGRCHGDKVENEDRLEAQLDPTADPKSLPSERMED